MSIGFVVIDHYYESSILIDWATNCLIVIDH